MALGKFNFNTTAREREIRKLDDELKLLEAYRGDATDVVGCDAEAYFEAWVKGRHGHRMHRSGWPDYLLTDGKTGRVFAVEVKSEKDLLSKRQVECFGLLEQVGLVIYVWSPTAPKVLTPWRSFLAKTKKLRHD